MSEMIERVARAIWRQSVGPAQWDAWETFAPDAWGRVRSMAQACAAIEAMREPTEAMLSTSGYQDADEVWRDMIDAALAPSETDDNAPGGV